MVSCPIADQCMKQRTYRVKIVITTNIKANLRYIKPILKKIEIKILFKNVNRND